MDLSLTDEQRLIAATVHDFVERELYPHEDEVERLDEVPGEVARAIRKKAIAAGLYAANMPAELGGGGLDAVSLVLVERELGRASYALQMLVERPSNILQACQEEQRERYLLPAIRGERHDCVAMTEPEAGSDVRSMTITAVRDGDSYVVTGTKHFISHADVADFIILFAATGQEQTTRGPKKLITALLVDSPSPGLAVRRGPPCVSNRGYHHCELVFSGCRVPVANRLGEEGGGLELMSRWLGATRLQVAATSVGRARRVLEAATQWAASRRQFGQQAPELFAVLDHKPCLRHQRSRRAGAVPAERPGLLPGDANRLTKSRAVWATSCQPWSMVREWPRLGIFMICVTAGLRFCRL